MAQMSRMCGGSMAKNRAKVIACLCISTLMIVFIMAGCLPPGAPTSTPTASPTATGTASPTATPTQTASATPTPTGGTASPTATPVVGWQHFGLTGVPIQAITIDPTDPSIVFSASRGQGVFRSTDSGRTWRPQNQGLQNLFVNSIAIDPQDHTRVFAGTGQGALLGDSGAGIYRSTDGGQTWTRVHEMHVEQIVINPQNPSEIYAVGGPPVLKSNDGGAVWAPAFVQGDATANLTITSLAISPTDPKVLLISGVTEGGSGSILRSSSSGAPWEVVLNSGIKFVNDVTFAPGNGQIAYAGNGDGVWKSTDSGATWHRITESLGSLTALHVLVNPLSDNIIYVAAAEKGVYRSIDAGATWRGLSDGLEGERVRTLSIRISPEVLFAGTDNGVWIFVIAGTFP